MQKEPLVTIIIINYNGLKDTLECIPTVLNSTFTDFSIVILDNNSADNQVRVLNNSFKDSRIKVVSSDTNLGFAGGNNKVIRQSKSKYIVLLNNDTIVEAGWIESLITLAESDDSIAAIQPKIKSYYHRDFFEYAGAAGGFIDKLGYPYARGRIGFTIEKDQGQYDDISEIFWASGSCIFLRRDAAQNAGLLPEEFFFYHEETDLCWKLKNQGYKILFQPASVIYHKGSSSSKSNLKKKIFFVHRNNLLLILRNMQISQLVWVFPIRILLDIISCIYYFFKGQQQYIPSVLKAQYEVLKILPKIIKAKYKPQKNITLYPLSIFIQYFIFNKKRYSEIVPSTKSTEIMSYVELLPPNEQEHKNKKILKALLRPRILFPAITLVLILSWFRKGQILAGGEEALLFGEPARIMKVYSSPWYIAGTGSPMPVTLPRVPLISLNSLLLTIVPAFAGQALLFAVHITAALLGVYSLTKKLGLSKKAATIASLVYLFNLYTMTQVWGRMLMTGISLWAYLPWFVYLWIEIHTNYQQKFLLYFAVISFIFSFSYGHPGSIIVLWVTALLFTLTFCIKTRSIRPIIRSSLVVLFWFIINIWWIYPYVRISSISFASVNNTTENLNSLRGVSSYFPLETILQLRQKFYLSKDFYFGWYMHQNSFVITIISVIIMVIGIIKLRKNQFFLFLATLLLVALFISKGTNPAFGDEFYSWAFKTFAPTQALRNPYEKFGVVYVLLFSIFFAKGAEYSMKNIKSRALRSAGYVVVASIFLIYLVWPAWTGTVFGQGSQNINVTIPRDYAEINHQINSENADNRILLMPLLPGDGVKYLWSTGIYTGLEPSEYLFDKPTVARVLRSEPFDTKYRELRRSFDTDKFVNSLQELNIRYIVLQKKIDHIYSGTIAASESAKIIEKYTDIDKIKETENTILYKAKTVPPNNRIFVDTLPSDQIKYKQISQTKFIVTITNASQPFNLIFKESFSDNWTAVIESSELTDHKIAYSYANMWYVDRKGSYEIVLEFKI